MSSLQPGWRVNGSQCLSHRLVAGHVRVPLAGRVLVRHADLQIAAPVAGVRERVGLVDHHILKAAVAEGVALLDCVEPAHHALAAGARAELDLLELHGERMRVVHLLDKRVRAHFGVVGLGHAKGVDALYGDAGALEKFRRVGVRRRDVRREAAALVEPVRLAKFADDRAPGRHFAQDEFAHLTDVLRQGGPCRPVDRGQFIQVERERGGAEAREIVIRLRKRAERDRLGIARSPRR